MASKVVHAGLKQVRPILSIDKSESRRRVLNLYRSWYRQCPYIVQKYDIPVTKEMCYQKLREKFDENRHVTDLRTIDLLIIKGQQELLETANNHKSELHVMMFFNQDTTSQKPTDFLSKFYDGHEP